MFRDLRPRRVESHVGAAFAQELIAVRKLGAEWRALSVSARRPAPVFCRSSKDDQPPAAGGVRVNVITVST
jgi:hypothetical protein